MAIKIKDATLRSGVAAAPEVLVPVALAAEDPALILLAPPLTLVCIPEIPVVAVADERVMLVPAGATEAKSSAD